MPNPAESRPKEMAGNWLVKFGRLHRGRRQHRPGHHAAQVAGGQEDEVCGSKSGTPMWARRLLRASATETCGFDGNLSRKDPYLCFGTAACYRTAHLHREGSRDERGIVAPERTSACRKSVYEHVKGSPRRCCVGDGCPLIRLSNDFRQCILASQFHGIPWLWLLLLKGWNRSMTFRVDLDLDRPGRVPVHCCPVCMFRAYRM